jgi:hypothetical protein
MPGPGPGRSTRSWAATPAHDQYQQADAPGASVLGASAACPDELLADAGCTRQEVRAGDGLPRGTPRCGSGTPRWPSMDRPLNTAFRAAHPQPLHGYSPRLDISLGALWRCLAPEWPARGLLYLADVWDDQCGQGHRHGLAGVIWPVRAHKPGLRFWLRCIVGSSSDRDHLVCTEDF